MTQQAREIVIYKNEENYNTYMLPLQPYINSHPEYYELISEAKCDFQKKQGKKEFSCCHCTALHREYIGTWEIKEDKLFLKNMSFISFDDEDTSFGIKCLFPGQKEVFADWFSGILIIENNKTEEKLAFNFQNGCLLQN